MKFLPIFILSFIFITAAHSSELLRGPTLSAEALASQLGVHSFSLIYKPDTPFKTLSYRLHFKTKDTDGSYKDDSLLLSIKTYFDKPQQDVSLVVMVDSIRSTVQLVDRASQGKGISLNGPFSTHMPPLKNKSGGYTLLSVPVDPSKPYTEENTKSILELILDSE